MTSVVIRCALIAVALVAGAWLVLGVRSLDLQSDATDVLAKAQRDPISADELRHGRDLLRRARFLSADEGPRLSEGLLLGEARRFKQWVAATERVVEDEPDNYDGWHYMYLASIAARDRQRADLALQRIHVLNPIAGAGLEPRPRRGS
jgi:hypothetical protein